MSTAIGRHFLAYAHSVTNQLSHFHSLVALMVFNWFWHLYLNFCAWHSWTLTFTYHNNIHTTVFARWETTNDVVWREDKECTPQFFQGIRQCFQICFGWTRWGNKTTQTAEICFSKLVLSVFSEHWQRWIFLTQCESQEYDWWTTRWMLTRHQGTAELKIKETKTGGGTNSVVCVLQSWSRG